MAVSFDPNPVGDGDCWFSITAQDCASPILIAALTSLRDNVRTTEFAWARLGQSLSRVRVAAEVLASQQPPGFARPRRGIALSGEF
jgi:hypothetical protein